MDLLVNTQPSVWGFIEYSCINTQDHSLLQAENCGPPHEHTAVSTRVRSVSLNQYSGPLPHTGRELRTSSWTHSHQYQGSFSVPVSILRTTPYYRQRTVDLLMNTQPSVPGLIQCPCINTQDHSLLQAENCGPPNEHTAISTRAHSVSLYQYSGPLPHTGRELRTFSWTHSHQYQGLFSVPVSILGTTPSNRLRTVDLFVNTQPSVRGLIEYSCINTRDHSLLQAETCGPPREHTAISTRTHSVFLYQYSGPLPPTGWEPCTSSWTHSHQYQDSFSIPVSILGTTPSDRLRTVDLLMNTQPSVRGLIQCSCINTWDHSLWQAKNRGPPREHTAISTRTHSVFLYQYLGPLPPTGWEPWTSSWTHSHQYEDSFSVPVSILGTTPSDRLRTMDLLVNTQPSVRGLIQCSCINTWHHSLIQAENCGPPNEHTTISTRAHSVSLYQYSGPLPHTGRELRTSSWTHSHQYQGLFSVPVSILGTTPSNRLRTVDLLVNTQPSVRGLIEYSCINTRDHSLLQEETCGPPREHTAISTRTHSVFLYQYSGPLPPTGWEPCTSSWTHSHQYKDSFSVPVSILGTTPSDRLRTVDLLMNTQPSVRGLIQCSCINTWDHSLWQAKNRGPPREHTAISTRTHSVFLYQYLGPLPPTGWEPWTSSWTHSHQYEDSFSVPVSILGTTPSDRLRTMDLLVNTQPSVRGLIQCSCINTWHHSPIQAENCGHPREHTAVSTRARSVSLYQYSGPLPPTGRELCLYWTRNTCRNLHRCETFILSIHVSTWFHFASLRNSSMV